MTAVAATLFIGSMIVAPFSVWDKPNRPYFFSAACVFLVAWIFVWEWWV